ncbi:unnamed protein product [Aureobasidium uvarum]|uniref:Retinoic acid induced 16-like protein-domain-containing protein n=1 Tax=Aureobasidium uvarum TaxID=2773716 RepID=A0A9N8PRK2_9PEZI|nr:unnamed protein product [Aureobasidium uvarum]
MDFWTKLINGVSNNKSATAAASSPQQRLQRFRRAYNPILQLCGRPQTLASHGPALDQLYSSLQTITTLLAEESRSPAPHLCLNFTQSSQIYSVVARAASTSRDPRLVRQTVILFSLLLESEDEDFVASPTFAKSFMRFALRVIDSNQGGYGEDIETHVVELLFAVVAKIRIQPDILSVWFSSHANKDDSIKDPNLFAGQTQKDDFPLCYLLIDRIHHDGRIGDFARTGLLYIFEAISNSTRLEDWIIESDLPTLMASGLGALYSQLSRELSILHDHDRLPMILALSDYIDAQQLSSTESIFSPTHATHMATFLSHLAFWQDVLEHCKSESVKTTLLDHFRVLFLQQLLYPSLLQSSDTDGGSSVAVLTYLSSIFESLDHPDLTRMVLQYLLAIPEAKQSEPVSPTVQRRQSTLMLLTQSGNDDDKFEPTLFSLVDLMLNGIRSQNSQTVVAALKLSSVMLTRHRTYTTSTLLQSKSTLLPEERRTIQALCVETNGLIQIATGLGGEIDVDEAYATACQDITVSLEVQVANKAPKDSSVLKILSHDPYIQSIAALFGSFFTNSVDVNLALTEATICLASCAGVGLDGWLAVPRMDYQPPTFEPTFDSTSLDEDEIGSLRQLQSVYSQERREDSQDPLLLAVLRVLNRQVDSMRSDISIIDHLIEKRVAILGGAGHEDLLTQPRSSAASTRQSTESARPTENRQIQRLQAGSRQRSTSRESNGSRSSTPVRLRDSSLSSVPPRSSSLPQASQRQQPNSIFRPPPPESPTEETLPAENLSIQTESKQNEAQTLRGKIHFISTEASASNTIFEYVSDSVAHTRTEGDGDKESKDATLSHVVTNIVILQHFVVELAAVMRTRAIVFEEVAFT